MKRKIIKIDEALCNGCGNCVTGCSEGALQIVNNKAKLVKENFCDGFGDCIGTCPTGALTIEEREADEFDLHAVKEYLLETQGIEAVQKMEAAQKKHQAASETPPTHHSPGHQHVHGSCPGSRMRMAETQASPNPVITDNNFQAIPSELRQWPVQIHLVQPGMPIFKNKDLVLLSTCGPVASADVHWRFIRGRSVLVGCPKLDDTTNYTAKIGAILKEPGIRKLIVARMEVPCCGSLTMIARDAIRRSQRNDIVLEESIIGIEGTLKSTEKIL